MKLYGKSILKGILIASMLFAVCIPTYASDTYAYTDDFEGTESPAFQTSADLAGRWLKPSANAEYLQDYVDEDRGYAFKATVTGTTNARNLEYILKKQTREVVLFETLFKVEDFNSDKNFILRTDKTTEAFAWILSEGKVRIGTNTRIDIEAGKWYKLTSKLDVLNKTATNTLTMPDGTTHKGEVALSSGFTYARRIGVALMKTGSSENTVSSSLWLDDFSVDYGESYSKYSEAVYSSLSYDTSNITGSVVILKNKDIRFLGDAAFNINAGENKCISMDLLLKDNRSSAELWINGSRTVVFEGGKIKNVNEKLTNYSNNCYYKILIADAGENSLISVFDQDKNMVAQISGGQTELTALELKGTQNVRIKNICSVQQKNIVPEKKGLGNGFGKDRIKLVFPYDVSEDSISITLSGGNGVYTLVGDKTIELYGLDIGTMYNLCITGCDVYGNSINMDYDFEVKDTAYTFEFVGFYRDGVKMDKASAGNVDMILNVNPN